MRKERKYNYIYKTTCNVTKKYYIGMHSTDKLDDGYMGSGKRLWFSMNYHGKENHTKEILEYCDTREELKKREAEIVDEQLLTEDLCMNLMVGGTGGREFTDEERKKGWKITNEKHKDKLSEWASRGGTISIEQNRYDWNGKTHSEETKQKISETKKGQGSGKTNSQYGTCWVTNGAEVKKIKKEDLEEYLVDGWVKGRKI